MAGSVLRSPYFSWSIRMSLFHVWRDRLLGQATFQRWAARFVLTRPVARREARALFDICAGFVYAQVLAACVELDVFERVAGRGLRLEALAASCAVPEASMRMLVGAAASLRLLSERRGVVRLGGLGAALRGNPGIAAMVAHHRLFYDDVADPVALLRGQVQTKLSGFWPYRGQAGESLAYSALMGATQPMIAGEILDTYDVSKHRVVLDIGGGDGSFLAAVAARAPRLGLQLFDLPPVAARASARFVDMGLVQAATFGGDFTRDPLPQGADLITLVRVLHDHDDPKALGLLKKIRTEMPPEATLLLAEPMAGTRGAEPIGAAYFGFYLLAMGSGRARRPAEIEALLAEAGFSRVHHLSTSQPMLTGLITAEP
jgi:demethylspheroidene O-methyltransferase